MSRRLFDIVVCGCVLLLLTPLMLALALWIKCDSPGPVLVRQKRVGREAMVFDLLKFRSVALPRQPGVSRTTGEDTRTTRAGRFLRRHRLDDLPQLLNVLRGEMSLVGPRPELPRHWARYLALYSARHSAHYPADMLTVLLSVRPGLIDWAAPHDSHERAILARSADPERAYIDDIMPANLAYYVRYLRERSFWSDVRIVCSTLGARLR